jgi:hypothetical protein
MEKILQEAVGKAKLIKEREAKRVNKHTNPQ